MNSAKDDVARNACISGHTHGWPPGRRSFSVAFERLDLAPGRHEVVVAVYDDGWTTRLAEHRCELTVRGEGPEGAPLAPPHRWEALDLPPDQPAS